MNKSFRAVGLLIVASVCWGCGSSSSGAPAGPSSPTTPSSFSVTVSGGASVALGGTVQLSAQVRDGSGAVVPAAAVTWSSADNAVASVSATGLVTVSKIGPVIITAASSGASGTATVTGTLAPYTFTLSASTSASDQRLIMDSVQFAHTYFASALGRTIARPTTVRTAATGEAGCASGNSAAATTSGEVIFCPGNLGWTANGPIARRKITMHEMFHILQFEMGWIGVPTPGPEWMIEGAAEFVGFRATAEQGALPFDTALGCMAKEVSDFARTNPPGLPNLSAIELRGPFRSTIGPLYALSMLGVDRLSPGGATRLRTFGEAIGAGSIPQPAFLSAFGVTLSSFYDAWPAYLASVPVPANYLCGV